ncbi:Wall-associated receptor kinase, galacturonan-binding domain [Dillenia turbinata]|uniref:RING-type E3 ubiquitin transferase n=1 Tax=Dillenia turbinata TaxID=194707 RepID=A0AAN8Z5S4_9MAGN
MDTAFLILNLLSICYTTLTSAQPCYKSACSRVEPVIQFPFWLKHSQLDSCGYPGFGLSRHGPTHQTILTLPSGNFSVQGINYTTQEIWINDPNNCLPKQILSLNLSTSPFLGVFTQYFALFNCSFDYTKYGLNPIGCMSDGNYTVYATTSFQVIGFLSSVCDFIATVPVPVELPFYEEVVSSDLDGDLRLKWEEPGCGVCVSRGWQCWLKSNSSRQVECFNVPERGLPSGARYAITVGAGVPASMCILGLLCFLCGRVKSFRGRNDNRVGLEGASNTVAPRPIVAAGLDQSAIDSFPKVVVGESLRLPRPNDHTCPICLLEYKPKEMVRSIPECEHCFHADCIDEWLRLNATCPVCRNSPEKPHPVP